VHVKSSFSDAPGTWVVNEDEALESTVVAASRSTRTRRA
jgi:aspartokinase